ncbi:hypothetical protein TNCT_704761 [Trichonephila clavata]|uniref:Uncharacterized protein n=1 Tax=Trichonephila clavata TaxID=2740835 RepID=A0A8X6GSX7_TRICU|nr:hypothetical protein TNCT_704761 [Trichonephila clavata]
MQMPRIFSDTLANKNQPSGKTVKGETKYGLCSWFSELPPTELLPVIAAEEWKGVNVGMCPSLRAAATSFIVTARGAKRRQGIAPTTRAPPLQNTDYSRV